MKRYDTPAEAACTCGAVQVRVHAALTRFSCHCSICQRLGRAPFGDPVFLFRWHLDVADPAPLRWTRERWTPINVNRGICRHCDMLVLEHVAASPLSVVVAPAWKQPEHLPATHGHAFYETRVADIDDNLPKHAGYLASQAAITGWILGGVLGD